MIQKNTSVIIQRVPISSQKIPGLGQNLQQPTTTIPGLSKSFTQSNTLYKPDLVTSYVSDYMISKKIDEKFSKNNLKQL